MSGFRLAPEAEAELDEIWIYIARGSGNIDTATRVVDNISEHFWLLAQHPYLGRARNDWRPGLRSFAVRSSISKPACEPSRCDYRNEH